MVWLTILFAIFILLIFKAIQRDKDLPPGEYGWPIIGVLLDMKGDLKTYVDKVKGKYGNIFCIKVGSRIMVFLRNLEGIKHFNKVELSGRPESFTFRAYRRFLPGGMALISGPIWEVNRRFVLKHLREFGMGKSSKMQVLIEREVEEFIEALKTKVGEPTEIDQSLNVALFNVVWRLIADLRFDQNDHMMHEFSDSLDKSEKISVGPMQLLTLFPILVKILPNFVKNKWMKVDQFLELQRGIHQLLEETIKDHKKTLDKSNPRDYIDAYLIEMEERNEIKIAIEDPTSNLVACLNDLFSATMETMATTLKWFTLLMAAYPEVQSRAQEELDYCLPSDQLMPFVEDKNKFPFLQATIYEVMRHKTLLPLSVVHGALEDYHVDGYRIPKGAMVFMYTDEVHQDPNHWENPEAFNPDRFLDENGCLKKQPETLMPFGHGKRQCPGESMARMELFMFAGAILSNLNISLPEGAEANLMSAKMTPLLLNIPLPFEIILEKRK